MLCSAAVFFLGHLQSELQLNLCRAGITAEIERTPFVHLHERDIWCPSPQCPVVSMLLWVLVQAWRGL